MSTILSADDLNDFISPGVACIKPIEPIPQPQQNANPYEVTTEDKLAAANPVEAQISLTDCLACSGCVTSAEAVLVSLQSHDEVLKALDESPSLYPPWLPQPENKDGLNDGFPQKPNGKLFVASVSPQARASLAAAYGISSDQAGELITQLLCGPQGLAQGGNHGSSFLWVMDTNMLRSISLIAASEEVNDLLKEPSRSPVGNGDLISDQPKKPILSSACPGFICYVEKQHPYIIPYLSRIKSPQALAGTLLKSVFYKAYNIQPSQIWHLAIMPCFDKKLEASRSELTSSIWAPDSETPIRDVDCVITPKELINLASTRSIHLPSLLNPKNPCLIPIPFPDPVLHKFLFPSQTKPRRPNLLPDVGSSGGYLWHVMRRAQAATPGSSIEVVKGRNADVMDFKLVTQDEVRGKKVVLKCARYYGFRNIQNLVRKLKPAQPSRLLAAASRANRMDGRAITPTTNSTMAKKEEVDYMYVEVMACPGGCTNGGGQIGAGEAESLKAEVSKPARKIGLAEQKAWLATVDEAYFSAEEDGDGKEEKELEAKTDVLDGISKSEILAVLNHWERITGVDRRELVQTSYRKVVSDVGKKKESIEAVISLASGGW